MLLKSRIRGLRRRSQIALDARREPLGNVLTRLHPPVHVGPFPRGPLHHGGHQAVRSHRHVDPCRVLSHPWVSRERGPQREQQAEGLAWTAWRRSTAMC